jgi:hypothetical protein
MFGAGYLVHGLTDGGNDFSLTGREAIARAEAALRQSDPMLVDSVSVEISCDTNGFDTDKSIWSIRCLIDNHEGFKATEDWTVNAETGEVSQLLPVADSA